LFKENSNIYETLFRENSNISQTLFRENSNILNYIALNNKLTKYILDTRVLRSLEMETDHFLLVSPVRLPLNG
jgi:hypothetical protein